MEEQQQEQPQQKNSFSVGSSLFNAATSPAQRRLFLFLGRAAVSTITSSVSIWGPIVGVILFVLLFSFLFISIPNLLPSAPTQQTQTQP